MVCASAADPPLARARPRRCAGLPGSAALEAREHGEHGLTAQAHTGARDRLAPRDAAESLLVLNAHFGHAPWHHGPTARIVAAQLDQLDGASAGHGEGEHATTSVFLVGDFNALPSSLLLRSLTSPSGARFVDAARSAGERAGPPVTFHWGNGATRFGLTLDYVLARTPRSASRAEVIDVHDGRRDPSDHHLVVAEFSSPADGPA